MNVCDHNYVYNHDYIGVLDYGGPLIYANHVLYNCKTCGNNRWKIRNKVGYKILKHRKDSKTHYQLRLL